MIGERLFPMINQLQPKLAGKITGMFLEFEDSELLKLLENPVDLKTRVNEAMEVLNASEEEVGVCTPNPLMYGLANGDPVVAAQVANKVQEEMPSEIAQELEGRDKVRKVLIKRKVNVLSFKCNHCPFLISSSISNIVTSAYPTLIISIS